MGRSEGQQKAPAARGGPAGAEGDSGASVPAPARYSNKAEQPGAEEEEGGGLGDARDLECQLAAIAVH